MPNEKNETTTNEELPPGVHSNIAIMDQEHRRQSYVRAAINSLNLGTPIWFLAPGPLPDNHPFYELVGRVASEWGHLEHIVDLTIWKLLGVDQRLGACLTAQFQGLPQRCNAVDSLGIASGLTEEQVRPFRQLKNNAVDNAGWRARWVHDPWFVQEGDKPAQFRAMPAVDPRFGLQEISEDEIKNTITQIKKLQEQAKRAQQIVFGALASLPQKQK